MPASRILLVDDNPDQLATLSFLIRDLGHHVETATNGSIAIEVARRLRPDIAFIDLGLPVMNGHQVARALRTEFPAIRLYAITGSGRFDDYERSIFAGFDDHLTKPVAFQYIKSLLGSRIV